MASQANHSSNGSHVTAGTPLALSERTGVCSALWVPAAQGGVGRVIRRPRQTLLSDSVSGPLSNLAESKRSPKLPKLLLYHQKVHKK